LRNYAKYGIIDSVKKVIWMGRSKADLKSFPAAVMDDMGHQLFRVQCGLDPDDWKPISSIGTGVKEIRVRDAAGIFRTIYLATRPEAVYVLHCFQKKTQKTARPAIELARKRLGEILR
jgi:phage-related protein